MAQTTPSEIAGANSAAPVAVLVVDGNEDHQILSVAALTRKGWIVRTAGSRKQGLQLALSYHFDAVVIGSKLRDGSGIELLRALGGRLPGTPIIFVVPLGGEEAALQAMESGAQSYIVKTPRYNELLPAIVEEHVVEARNRKRLVETEQTQAQAVTARKTVEEQLSQSQARLKLVLEQAPVLLWSTDRDLRVTSAMGTGFRGLDLPRSSDERCRLGLGSPDRRHVDERQLGRDVRVSGGRRRTHRDVVGGAPSSGRPGAGRGERRRSHRDRRVRVERRISIPPSRRHVCHGRRPRVRPPRRLRTSRSHDRFRDGRLEATQGRGDPVRGVQDLRGGERREGPSGTVSAHPQGRRRIDARHEFLHRAVRRPGPDPQLPVLRG